MAAVLWESFEQAERALGRGSRYHQSVCVLILITSSDSMILPSAVTIEPLDERPFVLFFSEIYISNLQGVM